MCTAASFSQYPHLNACELGCLVAKWSIILVDNCVLHFLHFSNWLCALFKCCSRGSAKSREQRGHSCFLPFSLDLFGDTGGGVTGSLSFDCGVFIVSSFLFSFLLLGADGGAFFAVWVLLACCRFLVALDEVSLSGAHGWGNWVCCSGLLGDTGFG